MKTILRIDTVDIIPCPELSVYNFTVYKFKRANEFGVTHLAEVYDDVSDTPDIILGVMENGKFVSKTLGYADKAIPENKFNCGGVSFDVELECLPGQLVDSGALCMVINALRRDESEGKLARGEMANALENFLGVTNS